MDFSINFLADALSDEFIGNGHKEPPTDKEVENKVWLCAFRNGIKDAKELQRLTIEKLKKKQRVTEQLNEMNLLP